MSLYRKYRPLDFNGLEGQDHISEILRGALKTGKVSHAYLFTGPRGTGKTSTARIMSRAINCLDLKDAGPCNTCEICKGALEESLTDLVEIDAASHGLVDDARALVEQARFMPSQAKKKIYIIDEVHMLSKSAFNALLKIIEEPPEHVHFILATTEAHKVLDTIKSRCQRFDFHLADESLIVKQLRKVCDAEKVEADETALLLLAQQARGSFRDALSLLEQVIGSNRITEQFIHETLGISEHTAVESFLAFLFASDRDKALQVLQEVHEQGHDLSQFCQLVLKHLRQSLLKGEPNSNQILHWTDYFFLALDQLRDAFLPLLPLEIAVFKCLQTDQPPMPSSPPSAASKPRKISEKPAAPAPDVLLSSSGFDLQKFYALLPSAALKSLLKHSIVQLEGDELKIVARSEFELGKIREPQQQSLILAALSEMLMKKVSLRFEIQDSAQKQALQSHDGLSNIEVKSVFL